MYLRGEVQELNISRHEVNIDVAVDAYQELYRVSFPLVWLWHSEITHALQYYSYGLVRMSDDLYYLPFEFLYRRGVWGVCLRNGGLDLDELIFELDEDLVLSTLLTE